MKSKNIYSYTVLRYFHDIASGEFVNLGIVLYSPEHNFFNAIMKKTQSRVTGFFPDAKGRSLISLLKRLETHISQHGSGMGSNVTREMFEEKVKNVLDLATAHMPLDDSSLQWSAVSSGLTDNPEITLHRLFDRYVTRYDDKKIRESRSNEDVWQYFSRSLEQRNLAKLIQEHEIQSQVDSIKFSHALKNGKWHVLEPVSFDLADGNSIKRKAQQILGEMTILRDAKEAFDVYFLIGEPKHGELKKEYDVAINTLRMIPNSINSHIYTENEILEFENHISSVMTDHVN